jgi:hypothetical protein
MCVFRKQKNVRVLFLERDSTLFYVTLKIPARKPNFIAICVITC